MAQINPRPPAITASTDNRLSHITVTGVGTTSFEYDYTVMRVEKAAPSEVELLFSSLSAKEFRMSLPHRRFGDLEVQKIDRTQVIDDKRMFFILVISSFLETAAPLYTRNLITYFEDNKEIVEWLSRYWLPEEVDHGNAMKAYVNVVWPKFDWENAYQQFYEEFQSYCHGERYQPTKALEMLARCVTETGAATFYKAIRDLTKEPVLKALLDQMQRDEVRHYKNFLHYFRFYNKEKGHERIRLIETILSRGLRVYNEDAFIAYRHASKEWRGSEAFSGRSYRRFIVEIRRMVRQSYPRKQAVKMLLKTLDFKKAARRNFRSFVTDAIKMPI